MRSDEVVEGRSGLGDGADQSQSLFCRILLTAFIVTTSDNGRENIAAPT